MIWWVLSLASLVGVILNIYKRKECFYLWSVTNGLWIVYTWHRGAYPLTALFGAYFILALWGIWRW
jgi:nicotinamide riboside transporter PnuC